MEQERDSAAGCEALTTSGGEKEPFSLRFVLRIASLLVLCAIGCASNSAASFFQQQDFGAYHRAADYCRGNVTRPMALSPDKKVLCLYGDIWPGQDYSLAYQLEDRGLFVVRSSGGDPGMAIALATLLENRQPVVVVDEFCLSACASFLLLASSDAFVLSDSLVAWHNTSATYYCPVLKEARDHGPLRVEKLPCPGLPDEYWGVEARLQEMIRQFLRTRIVDPNFEMPPESITVRKRLQDLFAGTANCPLDLLWTWNPRHYAGAITTRIHYEQYPENQRELDLIASKVPFLHVIYDP